MQCFFVGNQYIINVELSHLESITKDPSNGIWRGVLHEKDSIPFLPTPLHLSYFCGVTKEDIVPSVILHSSQHMHMLYLRLCFPVLKVKLGYLSKRYFPFLRWVTLWACLQGYLLVLLCSYAKPDQRTVSYGCCVGTIFVHSTLYLVSHALPTVYVMSSDIDIRIIMVRLIILRWLVLVQGTHMHHLGQGVRICLLIVVPQRSILVSVFWRVPWYFNKISISRCQRPCWRGLAWHHNMSV